MTLRGSQPNGSVRIWRRHFPITSVNSLIDLMREILLTSGFQPDANVTDTQSPIPRTRSRSDLQCEDNGALQCIVEPDLAFVSIVLGFIENHLTSPSPEAASRSKSKITHFSATPPRTKIAPPETRSRRSSTTSSVGSKILPSPLSHDSTDSTEASAPDQDQLGTTLMDNYSASTTCSRVTHSDPNATAVETPQSSQKSFRLRHWQLRSQQNIADPSTEKRVPEPAELTTTTAETTSCAASGKRRRFSDTAIPTSSFPCLTFEETERLYQDFYSLIMTSSKLQPYIRLTGSKTSEPTGVSSTPVYATRCLIRTVCEVLWSRLTSCKHKEKLTHTQSVYSFLTTGLLDSFGLAYTTVAACQILGYSDVDLTLSEDHGWVEFGPPDGRQSADVASWVHNMHVAPAHELLVTTTRAPGSADDAETASRLLDSVVHSADPPPVRMPPLTHSWLYVNGHPVHCRPRILAVVAAVTALQPGSSLTSSPHVLAPVTDTGCLSDTIEDLVTPNGLVKHLSTSPTISMQVVTLKHRLLWLFYQAGCLARYPLGLDNLADLEDAFVSPAAVCPPDPSSASDAPVLGSHPPPAKQPSALDLYMEAVHVTQCHYANQHVYPYTCLAGYLYRHGDHRRALYYWANAARVIGQYNHSSEDWEVYRELLEIATQLMPHMFRCAADASRSCCEGSVKADPDGCLFQTDNLLDDPQCLAHLLAFYDHLCLWEEDSPVPVLHVGWVDKLMVNLARFSPRARRLLRLSVVTPELSENTTLHSPLSTGSRLSDAPVSSPISSSSASLIRRVNRRTRTRTASSHQIPGLVPDTAVSPATSCPDQLFPTKTMRSKAMQPLTVNTSISPLIHSVPYSGPASGGRGAVPCNPVTLDPKSAVPASKCRRDSKNGKRKTRKPQSFQLGEPSPSAFYDVRPYDRADRSGQDVVTKAEVAEVLSGLYQECDTKFEPPAHDLEDPDGSPSPPSMVEFSSSEDFLTTLVEACDRRLLNPAFLWGIEPHMPFLPADVAPEDAFSRLLASLEEPEPLTSAQAPPAASLFPTPPTSGSSVCDPVLDESGKSSSQLPDPGGKPNPPGLTDGPDEKPDQTDVLSLDGVKASDVFHPMSSCDLIDSVTEVVPPEAPLSPFDKPEEEDNLSCSHPNDFSTTGGDTNKSPSPQPPAVDHAQSMDALFVDLTLYSVKMMSIVDLLRASRLNASAIKLALTAQSQVSLRRSAAVPNSALSSVADLGFVTRN